MNTSISDMASFPIPPLGSHWSHESDLIGDLFDLTICIIIFRCPTDGISIALVQSEAIIFKIVPIGFEIYICMLAVEPAVSHMLSWRKEPASELCNRRHISDPFETPHLHCEQHSLLRVNLGPRLHHSDHQHRLCLASGPQEDLSSQVTGHRPEFQVLCRTTCVCVQHFCASPFSSNSRTTQ